MKFPSPDESLPILVKLNTKKIKGGTRRPKKHKKIKAVENTLLIKLERLNKYASVISISIVNIVELIGPESIWSHIG